MNRRAGIVEFWFDSIRDRDTWTHGMSLLAIGPATVLKNDNAGYEELEPGESVSATLVEGGKTVQFRVAPEYREEDLRVQLAGLVRVDLAGRPISVVDSL